MNICKKIISTICASVFAFSCFGFNVNAKVIEPEIVKTETWTTSYFIDDNMDTLYPYIQCEADIYNDGTIKLYMWNTHEWDGFATVSHKVTIANTRPESIEDDYAKMIYTFSKNEKYPENSSLSGKIIPYKSVMLGRELYPANEDVYKEIKEKRYKEHCGVKLLKDNENPYLFIDFSYIDSNYSNYRSNGVSQFYLSDNSKYYFSYHESWDNMYNDANASYCTMSLYESYYGTLPEMNFGIKKLAYEFRPKEDPTGTYNFRLYGHDITITPELLSGNIIAEPELTEQEKYIKQLEEENSKLKTEIESYKKLDFDGDGLLTNADAQMILIYYTNSLVGKTTGKVEDYGEYIKLISN